MQEEVTQKTIALVIKTAKLDANVLKAAMRMYLNHSLQDVGIQFSGLNYKSDCFLRYFLLHKYLRSAFPCAYAPLRWNIQPM